MIKLDRFMIIGVFCAGLLFWTSSAPAENAATDESMRNQQTAPTPPLGTITQLFAFPCSLGPGGENDKCPDGASLNTLIQASDGNFYGMAASSELPQFQGGTIFKLTPSGLFTLLFTFTPGPEQNFPNGNGPSGALVEAQNGLLFGTTFSGGSKNSGVVFQISKTGGGFKVLHNFCQQINCSDGAGPIGLTMANDGSLFGATQAGGTASPFCIQGGCGTIFRITESGSFEMLHALSDATDGSTPQFGLLKASDGNLYGLDQGSDANGNIFKVTPQGEFSVVFSLPVTDTPVTGLVQVTNGDLYGATQNGEGATEVQLFKLKLDGAGFESLPPSFNATTQLETFPTFIQASDGNLWSVFPDNGASGNGTVFSLGLDGKLLRTISFDGTNGRTPTQLLQRSDGTLVGVTAAGGVVNKGDLSGGTIFTLNDGLPAPSLETFTVK